MCLTACCVGLLLCQTPSGFSSTQLELLGKLENLDSTDVKSLKCIVENAARPKMKFSPILAGWRILAEFSLAVKAVDGRKPTLFKSLRSRYNRREHCRQLIDCEIRKIGLDGRRANKQRQRTANSEQRTTASQQVNADRVKISNTDSCRTCRSAFADTPRCLRVQSCSSVAALLCSLESFGL